ncbi:putative stress-response protein [Klebsiella pneumoniae]|uniref:Putative stress-response protein n=1 Tax=Klebsiella pneumoniae TaxID=573 RepID=A0A2X3EX93_KLEPN|nr:putative stress-response protein [Klebsiella pneumoniae]
MNKDEIGGNWKQFKGKAKEQWGKLTDDDMTVIGREARPAGRQNSGALRL